MCQSFLYKMLVCEFSNNSPGIRLPTVCELNDKKGNSFSATITFFVCLGLKHAEFCFGGYDIFSAHIC